MFFLKGRGQPFAERSATHVRQCLCSHKNSRNVEILYRGRDSNAIKTASTSLSHLGWFEVKETRGLIDKDKIAYYQVALELGFRYEK